MTQSQTNEYQPRYLAYCRARGYDPEVMLQRDREQFPGGCMAGYINWISNLWNVWESEGNDRRAPEGHEKFDAWLEDFVLKGETAPEDEVSAILKAEGR